MIVVGGTYSEYCYHPEWDQVFGSGGRGAATLTRLGAKDILLKTCIPKAERRTVEATLSPFGVDIDAVESKSLYEFIYTHPLSEPYLKPFPAQSVRYKKQIRSDVALVYGMLEGLPRVSANRIIFDPQSETDTLKPLDFIDQAKEIALVLNEQELADFSGESDFALGATKILSKKAVKAVVVKRGPYGATVFDAKNRDEIPVFPSPNVFKIGSGDVFSAAFSKFWGLDGQSPREAAEKASRCASVYCNTRSLDQVAYFNEIDSSPLKNRKPPTIYLAGPFFSLGQRIMIEEARRSLLSLGAKVFSPLHDVGTDDSPEAIAREDLRGLRKSDVVLALISDLDPGTIFEIGFARSRKIPVVAYGEGIQSHHLTMLIGSECICSEDFCSALYNSIWAGLK